MISATVPQIRAAGVGDEHEIATLLSHLGYPAASSDIPGRLERMLASNDAAALVAIVTGEMAGLATVHRRFVLHASAPVVQLTALVVRPEQRGRGIGAALVAAVARWALEAGAGKLVVTTALHRADAPLFYERLGFEHTGRRYVKVFGRA